MDESLYCSKKKVKTASSSLQFACPIDVLVEVYCGLLFTNKHSDNSYEIYRMCVQILI